MLAVMFGVAVLAAAAVGDTVQALVLLAVGVVQPWVQELIVKNKLEDAAALAVSWVASYGIAVAVVYVTGGLAGGNPMPALNLADPSAFLIYWSVRLLPVRLAAGFTYQLLKPQIKATAGTD